MLAGEPLDEVAADDFAAVFHPQQRVAQGRPVAPRQLAGHHCVARQQELSAGFFAFLGREPLLFGERTPPSDRRQVSEQTPGLTATRPPPAR